MLCCVPPLAAQNPTSDDLNAVLRKWEQAMGGLRSYVAVVERTTIDKALDVTEKHQRYAMMPKAENNARIQAGIECEKTTNVKSFERYIYSGADLYEYAPASNTVRHHKLATNAKGIIEKDSFVSLVLGMTVKHVQDRFDLKPDSSKPIDGFYYVSVQPKNVKDQAEFSMARLAFDRTNHLIAQIWFRQANGSEVTWEFSKMQINVQIPAEYFQPALPAGWRLEVVNAPLALPMP